MQAESSSLTLKLDLTACCLAVFRKGIRNLPACCRGFATSTPARNFQAWMHWQQFCRRFRFCALQVPTSTPVVRVLNAEAHVLEVALQPAERPEFALTNSQGPF